MTLTIKQHLQKTAQLGICQQIKIDLSVSIARWKTIHDNKVTA